MKRNSPTSGLSPTSQSSTHSKDHKPGNWRSTGSPVAVESTVVPLATRSLSSFSIARSEKKALVPSFNTRKESHISALKQIEADVSSNFDKYQSDCTDQGVKKNKAPKLAAIFSAESTINSRRSNECMKLNDAQDEGCEVRISNFEPDKFIYDSTHKPVRPSIPLLKLTDSATHRETIAAIIIQRWFRQNQVASKSAVKNSPVLYQQKNKLEHVKVLLQEKKVDLGGKVKIKETLSFDAEKKRRRAVKLSADRKAAIDEMRKKKEEKRLRKIQLAHEEMVMMEAKGISMTKKHMKKSATEVKYLDSAPQANLMVPSDSPIQQRYESKRMKSTPPPDNVQLHIGGSALSAYGEIMDTLRLLEEVPSSLSPEDAIDVEHGAVNTEHCVMNTEHGAINSERDEEHGTNHYFKLKKSMGVHESKLQSILTYLDQVETAEVDRSKDLTKTISDVSDSHRVFEKKGTYLANVQSMEAASASVTDVTATIMAQRMELDTKNTTIGMLQKALNQQRELTLYHAKEMEKEGKRRLDLQKAEYETTIKRHQCFIDQLIDDKKVLNERCENLLKELKDLDKKYVIKLTSLKDCHVAEMTKIKQVSAAADKLRKEKWQAEETQRIKEATVKGLEPEIQRIIAKGKSEVHNLKAVHDADLAQGDERANRKFVGQMEELREQCAIEREQACSHEREIARQRYEKLVEHEEVNFQQQRRRLFTEIAQEKEKIADELFRQKTSFEIKLKDTKEIHHRVMEEMKISHAHQLEEVSLRRKVEMRSVHERVEAEYRNRKECQQRKREGDIQIKEHELRKQLREERDREIELVISKLEEEMVTSKEENERTTEAKIRRIREKCEAEVREAEQAETTTIEKFNAIRAKAVDLEGDNARLHTLLHQRDQELKSVDQIASKLSQERDQVSDVVRQEFIDRLVVTEEENKDLKKDISELRVRHRVELERVRKCKELELIEVHERVKQALEKKEGNLEVLKEQYEGAVKRADHLQMLLQRQRNQLLKK